MSTSPGYPRARRSTRSTSPAGILLEAVDELRRLHLGELGRHLLVGFLSEGVQVRLLWTGHRLVTGRPVLRVFLRRAVHRDPLPLERAFEVPRASRAQSPAEDDITRSRG